MKKSIVTIVAFMLFALAGFAQNAEVLYIRVVGTNGGKNLKAIICEKGVITEVEMPSGTWAGKHTEEIIPFAALLDKYYAQGYRIVSSTLMSSYKEYILQKD